MHVASNTPSGLADLAARVAADGEVQVMQYSPEWLATVRRASGLTQEDLAERLASATGRPVRSSYISAWEHGKRTPNAQVFAALLAELTAALDAKNKRTDKLYISRGA